MEQHQQQRHLIEQRQTDQNRDEFLSWLRFLSWITTILGLVLLFTSNGSGPSQSSSGPSSAFLALTEMLPYIMVGMTVITSLVMLILAFVTRKESNRTSVVFLIIGLFLIASALLQFIMIPQPPQIVPVSH